MLSDPQSVTVNAVAKSMPRVSSTGKSAVYEAADSLYKLTVSHQITAGNRIRSLVRMDHKAVVTNPLDSTNDYDQQSVQIVFDRPSFGFTSAQLGYDWAGLKAWLDDTMIGKLFGQES